MKLKIRSIALAVATAVLASTITAAPASALYCKPSVPRATCTVQKLHLTSVTHHVRGAVINECTIVRKGSSCSIGISQTHSRTVSTALTVTVKFVAAQLGISATNSLSINTTCLSPKNMSVGSTYRAYYKYTKYVYWLETYKTRQGTKKSGTLVTYRPTGVMC